MIQIGNTTYAFDDPLVIAVAGGIILVLGLLFFRATTRGKNLRGEISTLNSKLDQKADELRGIASKADRAEAQADERARESARLNGDLSKLRAKLDEKSDEQIELSKYISRLETQMKSERVAAEEKIQLLTRMREQMESRFRELAQEALKTQGDAFSKSNIEKLESTLKPLKEHVGLFGEELKQVHQETVKDRERLKAEIRQLSQRSEEISQEAVSLTQALKGDQQKQGAWGEMILESVLERSGLRNGEEYEIQAYRVGSEGERFRPDVVVRIPGEKTLVIDSKVSLVAYSEAVNAETEEEASNARKRHVMSLHAHIKNLAGKGYHAAEDTSVDYVIMFVPVEGALSEALREDGNLTELAIENNIMIATPTTLMMALRTIANVWAVERRNKNAEQIAARAGSLYDKVSGFVDNLEKVGNRLDQANDAYNQAFDQLSRGRGNVLAQVDKLKTLGAKTNKSIGVEFDDDDGTVHKIAE